MKRLFHHPADAVPTVIITAGAALALLPFFIPLPIGTAAAVLIGSFAARSIAPVHHHCHSHRRVFRLAFFNIVYDCILLLAAGNPTAVWELQHVLGHHQSYLAPERDPAGVARFGGDGPLQRIIFTVAGDFSSIADSFRVARRQKHAARMTTKLVAQLALMVVVSGGLIFWNPTVALVFVIAPNIVLRWMVFYFSYAQHHGVPNQDVYSGSVTRFGWTNAVFLNVGHHTAHHEKPTLHWTLLPARTEVILQKIPAQCVEGAP